MFVETYFMISKVSSDTEAWVSGESRALPMIPSADLRIRMQSPGAAIGWWDSNQIYILDVLSIYIWI